MTFDARSPPREFDADEEPGPAHICDALIMLCEVADTIANVSALLPRIRLKLLLLR